MKRGNSAERLIEYRLKSHIWHLVGRVGRLAQPERVGGAEVSNALPGSEPNAEEAPYFKEAIMNALRREQEAFRRRTRFSLGASWLP